MNQLYNELINGIAAMLVAAIPIITAAVVMWLRSKWKLAGILFTQARVDKLNAAIQNQIRAEADKLSHSFGSTTRQDVASVPAAPEVIVRAVQPKIEANFKETLKHLDLKPGSTYITDIIRGQVAPALAPKVVIPNVMARS